MTLKAELEHIKNELASKIDELERLKSNTISRSVITGGDEENKPNNSLMKYFIRKKIDTIIPANTDNRNIHIFKSLKIDNKIQPSSEICPEVSDTEISRVEDPLQCNKNSTISPNETYPQISIDEAEAIPAVVESKTHYSAIGVLGLLLIALLLLALLIIVTVWIMFIRPIWDRQKKIKTKNNDIYRDTIPL